MSTGFDTTGSSNNNNNNNNNVAFSGSPNKGGGSASGSGSGSGPASLQDPRKLFQARDPRRAAPGGVAPPTGMNMNMTMTVDSNSNEPSNMEMQITDNSNNNNNESQSLPSPPAPVAAPVPAPVAAPVPAQPPQDDDEEELFAPSPAPKKPAADDDFLVDTDEEEEEEEKNAKASQIPRRNKSAPSSIFGDDDMQILQDKQEGDAVQVHEDVEFIDQVEWATDENSSNYGELADKPRPETMGDPCGCQWDGIVSTVADTAITASPSSEGSLSDSEKTNHRKTTISPTCCMDPSCILFACQEECRSNCEAGIYCGNKRIQKRLWKNVQVFHAGHKGRGLRLLEPVKKGEFILEYVGRAVRASYLHKLFQRYKQERRLYIMALDTNVYLDARKKGGVARYINHSCQPNCVVERWKVRGIIRAGIFAKHDIPKGTELSFDYQWERKKGRAPTKCYCGTPTCRGTLEMPKSLDELELEKTCEGHWAAGPKQPSREIINRSIRILSNEHQQYFYAEVCKYDEITRKHLVIYRQDWEEVWEDLTTENWQLLDDKEMGQDAGFVIAKKARAPWQQTQNKLVAATATATGSNSKAAGTGTGLLAKIGVGNNNEELKTVNPFLYVQTPIKEAFFAKHLIQRCERNCRVTIQTKQLARPPLAPDPSDIDDVEKHKALDESLDGSVWRLTVTGYNVAKAITILEKNVTYLTNQMALAAGGDATNVHGGSKMKVAPNRTMNGGTNVIAGATGAATSIPMKTDNVQEVVMPRCVVDNFKRRLPMVREKCRSVNISFAHSESKSKQFAKLLMEATLQSDLYTARESVWNHLNAACREVNAPKTHTGVFYRDLGFMGGEIPREKFDLLVQDKPDRLSQDCREDLRRSPFFASFEATQRCTVWVQSEEDKGRIDGSNNIVGEATPDAPRKVFFGCDPKDVSKLWTLVQTRASEVARGVKYLYLGADRVYLPSMIQNGAKFFDYVKRVTSASVIVDHMTGNHLRIDGRSYPTIAAANVIDLENTEAESEIERVAVAEEMVRLQIEIYRDHSIRQQNWIFGRDWTLSKLAITESVNSEGNFGGAKSLGGSSTRLQFDEKTISNSCQEIADITVALGSSGSSGISAAIIFYRFVALVCQREDYETQLKVREIVLACLFLANKAQKVSKWKRLDAVLKAAYQVFYPGASFDGGKEEVLILADKVLLAETEILELLDFDIFCRGTQWMIAAAVDSAGFKELAASEALTLACSGPVLAAGSTLWLRYGVEYVFAAAAGFLRADLEMLCPALSLIPLKVFQAAELIADSVKVGSASKRGSTHFIFEAGKESLLSHIPRIKETCVKIMTSGFGPQPTARPPSESEQRFRMIGSRDCRRHTIQGVPRALMKKCILPTIDGASAESKCNIYIGESAVPDADDIVLEGSWRAVAIADHLLRTCVAASKGSNPLPPAIDISVELDVLQKNKLQAKDQPGLLNMKNMITGEGWSETIQSEISGDSTWGRKTGGKICVPGKLSASSLREVGLRWWIPPQHGPSPTGSICDMFLVRAEPHDPMEGLRRLARSFMGQSESFPKLAGLDDEDEIAAISRFVAVSLQRWPSEKVESRELQKTKKSKRSPGLGLGFSAAALQEMQLLNELHSVIPSPQGHPNFLLPVAVALPSDEDEEEEEKEKTEKEAEQTLSTVADDIFSLFRTSEENEKVARREKKRKDLVTGPHLVFQPSPFVLERFMQKKKKRSLDSSDSPAIGPAIFSAWVHDLLSALVHCHTNHVVVRSFQSDQIIVDHSGVAKLGGLYRASLIAPEDRNTPFDPIKFARANRKDRKSRGDDDEDVTNPYVAPENLLGCSKQTKEGDIWSLGCLLAHVLLSKSLFSGRDRHAMLNSMYKIVGSPSTENYKHCKKFPNFEKPLKKYKRGVEKALQHILKDESEKHQGAIDLLSKMLHLDPSERITAVEALRHQYMLDYLENNNSEDFRRRFVEDWMTLKGKLMKSTQSQDDEARLKERSLKRKAALLAASNGEKDEQDDLYNLDELFATDDAKKQKI